MILGEEFIYSDKSRQEERVPILGLYKSTGNIILFGDSNCLDSNHLEIGILGSNKFMFKYIIALFVHKIIIVTDCYWLLDAFLEYISTGNLPHVFHQDNVKINDNNTTYHVVQRAENNEFHKLD